MKEKPPSVVGRVSRLSRLASRLGDRPRLTRILVILPVLAAGFALFPPSFGLEKMQFREGEPAPRAVVAEFDFHVLKNAEVMEREQASTEAKSPIALMRNRSVADTVFAELGRFRRRVRDLRAGRQLDVPTPELKLSQDLLVELMLSEQIEPLFRQAESLLEEALLDRGLVERDVEPLLRQLDRIQILDPAGAELVGVDRVQTPSGLRAAARNRALARGLEAEPLEEIVLRFARPNLLYDALETEQLRQTARDGVDPIAMRVKRGERIVEARERVTPEIQGKLESYDYWRRQQGGMSFWGRTGVWVGRLLLLCLGIGAFFAYLRFLRTELYQRIGDQALLALVSAIVMALSGLLMHLFGLSPLLAPVATAPILIALLFDERLALVFGLGLTGLIGLLAETGVGVIAVLGAGAVTAVFCVRGLRDRRQFYRILLFVPLVHGFTLLGIALAHGHRFADLLRDLIPAFANPLLSAGLAVFFLPIAEHVFRKCSDVTLLECSDLNRPLLRRLMVEAPGTYHHSLMVGSLAETAAQVSNANPLLARVIGYYHDIGKVTKPDYFIENISVGRKNPHDRLTPSMSRLIVESHVREGVALAVGERLPHIVVEGIRQHHGGSLMTFFWMKAKRLDPQAHDEDFRYPGPIPQSREAALVMLADQVDAASRALEDPTPSRIKGVVVKVLETRLGEGSLDESELTLSDLARIRDAFIPILVAFFHSRATSASTEDDAKGPTHQRGREPTTKSATS